MAGGPIEGRVVEGEMFSAPVPRGWPDRGPFGRLCDRLRRRGHVADELDHSAPVRLQPVHELSVMIERVLVEIRGELHDLAPGAAVEHIGATAFSDGVTKGDLDVNLRIAAREFGDVVALLSARYEIAQPQNWTPTYASFSDAGRVLPVGIQVTVLGSPDDFLVALRDRFLNDKRLRRRYDRIKKAAASLGLDGYWRAKDAFLGGIRD